MKLRHTHIVCPDFISYKIFINTTGLRKCTCVAYSSEFILNTQVLSPLEGAGFGCVRGGRGGGRQFSVNMSNRVLDVDGAPYDGL